MVDNVVVDYVVVGGGIAGASVAYHLADHASVTVLEREEQPGYHSTGRSAAMFMEAYGTPQFRALTRAGREFYSHPPAVFGNAPLMTPRPCLYVAKVGQADLIEKNRQVQGLQEISVARACELVPCLKAAELSGVLLEADAKDLDVHNIHQGFLRGLKQKGGALICNAELEKATYVDSIWTIQLTSGQRLQAKYLVNAAGAWADHVAQRSGVQGIGLQPKRRTAFTFSMPESEGTDFMHWPMVAGLADDFYFKPDAGQMLGSPANADPVPAQDVQPEELDVAMGIYAIETMSSLQIRRPNHVWAGLRSFVADGDLVVGFDDQIPSFFWLAGQGGYGIQSAAGVSLMASNLLLNQPLADVLVKEGVQPDLLNVKRLRK